MAFFPQDPLLRLCCQPSDWSVPLDAHILPRSRATKGKNKMRGQTQGGGHTRRVYRSPEGQIAQTSVRLVRWSRQSRPVMTRN